MALAGTNTYTHFTTVNNGILMLAGNGNLGSGVYNAVITNNATFVDNSAKVQVLGGVIYGTGTLAVSNAAAVLKLAGVNTYTGPTIIGAGTLALTNAGLITGSTSIQVNSGAILDVSKTVSGLTLASGQTLTGSGVVDGNVTNAASSTIAPGGPSTAGTLTVTNAVTLGGSANILMVLNSGGSSSELVATNITYGGTLTLNNVGPAYAAGNSFTLFAATNYSGAFASLSPTTPGAGLAWNTNALNTSGVLSVLSTGPGIFTNKTGITSFSLNGANVVLTGTNGQAGDAYYLLESTNVAKPISQWVPVATNVLGANGNYTFTSTNVVIPGYSQQFYILSNTNN
jgi:autotransporter-associated beta strand protein/predicted outer membrane repeat protein